MKSDPSTFPKFIRHAIGKSGLVAELNALFTESAKLELAIKANLRGLGYGF